MGGRGQAVGDRERAVERQWEVEERRWTGSGRVEERRGTSTKNISWISSLLPSVRKHLSTILPEPFRTVAQVCDRKLPPLRQTLTAAMIFRTTAAQRRIWSGPTPSICHGSTSMSHWDRHPM